MADAKTGSIVKAITFANTSAFDIGDLPPNSLITDIYITVGTAFNAGGNDYVDVGVADDTDKYADNINVASVGRKEPSGLTNIGAVVSANNSTRLQAIYVPSATAPSAGAGYVHVEYQQL
jgi:hypothetical protein